MSVKALTGEDDVKWRNAMQKEIESLHSNDLWDLVELPSSRTAVGLQAQS